MLPARCVRSSICSTASHACSRSGSRRAQHARGVRLLPRASDKQAGGSDGGDEGIEAIARDVLQHDPTAQRSIARIVAAEARVAELRQQRAAVDAAIAAAAEDEALRSQFQRASVEQSAAADELEAALKAVEDAQRELAVAQVSQQKWIAAVDEDAERVESAKAAVAAAIGGLAGAVPAELAAADDIGQLLIGVATSLASCVLFGVVYRYAVRRDVSNTQLKGGVVAAFGLVRGLAQAQLVLRDGLSLDSVGTAAVACGQSMLLFAFATACLEFCFQRGIVRPFGAASAEQQQ